MSTQKRSISTSVEVEIGHTCFQKNRISNTAEMQMGPVRISKKMNGQICFDGKGALQIPGKRELQNQFWRKFGMSHGRKGDLACFHGN